MSLVLDDLRGMAGDPLYDRAADEIEELERQNALLTQMLDSAEKEVEKLRAQLKDAP